MPSVEETTASEIAAAYVPPLTGRPAAIGNAAVVQELLTHIGAGNYYDTAAEIAGIAPRTLDYWLERGETGEEPYNAFLRAVKRAERKAEALAVSRVRAAGEKPQFWAAEMTFLQRRHPQRWSQREESSGPRVIVQIGVKDSDVQVVIGEAKLGQQNIELSDTNGSRTSLLPE